MPMFVGDLCQRLIGDLDVVGGGIGVRVPGPQHPGQRFPGVVQPGEQGVISIAVLVCGRRLLLLGMAGHQGGVEIDHQAGHHHAGAPHDRDAAPAFAAQQPRSFPGSSTRDLHLIEQRFVDRVQHPPRCRGGGHRPEQVRLVTQHRQVADRHPAIGEHHRQIGQHPTRRMRRAALPPGTSHLIKRLTNPSRSGNVGQQPRPHMRANTPPIGADYNLRK
jgi:hypothetical protein